MRQIHGWLLACGLIVAVSSVSTAQEPTKETGKFGPIPIFDAYGRPLAVYRNPYEGPFNKKLDKIGDKMRAAGMSGGLTPLYLPGNGPFGYYGDPGFGSPLYHAVGSSTEPSPYYSPVFNGIAGYPSPEAASRPYTYSPPWSKDYRQGQPRQHKLFGRLTHKD